MSKNTGKKLVIVESPTKAKTIRKFLGKEYTVESCMGHVRDLPQSAKDIPEKFKKEKWANLGVNVNEEFEPIYCVPKTKTRIVKTLKDKLLEVDELILATDEDREGESISWHLVEVLKPKVPVKRMVFHEITKEAIQEALNKFRVIDEDLVRAQEARRILDRLVGYSISPLLWKKVTYGLSAGRVQSVAVRLIAEREHERLRFKRSKYWTLSAANEKDGQSFESRSHQLAGKRVATGKDFDSVTGALLEDKKGGMVWLNSEADAQKWATQLTGKDWIVDEVEEKPISRKPAPPFITSTLQQESNRKLGFSSRETMELAQKLYERGFITYMRTDSTNLSTQAIEGARETILKMYGKSYLPAEARLYTGKKAKGAQEAHEAIRPAGTVFMVPEETGLTGGMLRLYELIWKRTVASQMTNSEQKLVSVKFKVADAVFATSGMTIEFPGFLKVYVEDQEDDGDEKEMALPKLKVGDKVKCSKINTVDHETKPPARFTEASLVQTMEREGIGRPSTYATIISTIQDRGYVRKVGNALVPTFTALVVSKLLRTALPTFVDLGFTSEMERSLDTIADGDLDYVKFLSSIYFGDKGLKSQVETQEKAINAETSRSIQLEGLGELNFRIGKYGAYVCRKGEDGKDICASLPEAQVPGDMTSDVANKLIDQKINGTDALGKDPKTGMAVYVLTGRYGPYVQLGDNDSDQLKRMAIPANLAPESLPLEQALMLLELPKTLGPHPETGKDIKKGLGRFGPYVVHEGDYRSIPRTENIFAVDLARALELFAQPKRMRGRSAPLKELGVYADTNEQVQVHTGKYGPYIKVGGKNISLPEDMKVEDVTLEKVLPLIQEKLASGGGVSKKAGGAKKSAKAEGGKVTPKKVAKKATPVESKPKAPARTVLKKRRSQPRQRPLDAWAVNRLNSNCL